MDDSVTKARGMLEYSCAFCVIGECLKFDADFRGLVEALEFW